MKRLALRNALEEGRRLYQDQQSLAQAAVAEVGVSEVTLDPGPPEVQARAR